jgi:hypothetical protein
MRPHLVLLPLALCGLPASAQAATWSSPVTVGAVSASNFGEPGPRVAMAGREVVAAWVDTERSFRVFATVGDPAQRLRSQLVGTGLRPAVAINAEGAAAVVFQGRGQRVLHVAVRAPGARRFGASRVITATTGRFDRADFPQVAADGTGRFVVMYERGVRTGSNFTNDIRALTLTVSGRPIGAPQSLGKGALPARSLRALADGRLVALTARMNRPAPNSDGTPTPPQLLLQRRAARGTAFTAAPITVPEGFGDPELVAAPEGALALAGLKVTRVGDAGSAGRPLAATATTPGSPFGPFAGPSVTNPARNFDPVAVPARGGIVGLLWQQKTAPQAFDRSAPIVATTIGSGGEVRTPIRLSGRAAREPHAVALAEGRGLAVWDDDGRWGSAEHRPDGSWRRVGAPRGSLRRFHDAVTNRDLQASTDGGAAAFVWEARGKIQLSVRR